LAGIYDELKRTSPKLALEFRAKLLETKQFSSGKELAQRLEEDFLRTYFGRNPKILWFARILIAGGHKAAAKELNRAISVLGAADENVIIGRIRKKFDLVPASVQSVDARQLAETLSRIGPAAPTAYAKADSLIKLLGGTVTVSRWMFGAEVPALGERRHFFSTYGLVVWVNDTIVPQVLSPYAQEASVVAARTDAMSAGDHGTESGKPTIMEPGGENGDYMQEASAAAASAENQGAESGKPRRSWSGALVTAGVAGVLGLILVGFWLGDTHPTPVPPPTSTPFKWMAGRSYGWAPGYRYQKGGLGLNVKSNVLKTRVVWRPNLFSPVCRVICMTRSFTGHIPVARNWELSNSAGSSVTR
jgi:hypothetical protein